MEYLLLILIFFLVPLFYLRVIKNIHWDEIKYQIIPKDINWKTEFVGGIKLFFVLVIGFLLIATALSIFQVSTGVEINDLEKVKEVITAEIFTMGFSFVILLLVVLFAEEFFFRLFLVPRVGMILSTLIFTFFHLGYDSITQTIGVFFLGLILAYWFKKNQSIMQNYFGHVLYDILAILLYIFI